MSSVMVTPTRVVRAAGLGRQPLKEPVRAATGVAQMSILRRSRRGCWASASREASIWSATVFEPALPFRSTMASGSPFPSAPSPLPRRRPRRPDRRQRPRPARCQGADQPGHHRIRGDRPGQIRLPAQHRDIGQSIPAQRQRCGQVRDDLVRVMHRPPRLQGR
jgi:hypothetical protein